MMGYESGIARALDVPLPLVPALRGEEKRDLLQSFKDSSMAASRKWVGLLFVIAVGCQHEKPTSRVANPPDAGISTAAKPIDVTLALNWYPEAEHGGFYAALVHGYFGEEGLNVTIRPGGPNVPVIPDVAAAKVEFAVDNADKLLLLRAQQADVVVVMSPMQNSPRCIMVHKKSGLTRLEDIAGVKEFTLAINPGQPFAQFLKKKVNLDEVRVVPYQADIAKFMEEPNYGQQAYSFSEPFVAEKQGGDPLCLMLSDIGFNTYTSVLITRREMIEQQSDVVAKMTRASIRGWKKYLAEPDETNKHIHDQNPAMGMDILEFGVKALRPVCLPEGFDESRLGEMSADRWQTLVSQMVEIGSIKPDSVKAEEAYSLKFIEPQ
jgi:NitT/TauT family transport system substrate-binding protein